MEFKMNDSQLGGKVVLVVGAVYRIGFKITKSLAETGATIVFNNLSPESAEQGLENYQATGTGACSYVCDVTSEEQVQAMVTQVKKEIGSIDILVNNAGAIKQVPMVEMSAKEFRQVTDVDLNAPFIMAKAVIPGMIEKGHDKIINVCSMMSKLGCETAGTYVAAGGGLKVLTKNIASEYRQYNIQCNEIGPDYTETPQTASLREPGHPFNGFILGRTPVNCWGTPAGSADLAASLAPNASGFVSGHVLYADGGTLAYTGRQP